MADEQEASFKCECDSQWTGPTCDMINLCSLKPCKNGGVCVQNEQGFIKCNCAAGFSGGNCEKVSNPCESSPCQNRGICFPTEDKYECLCDGMWSIYCLQILLF